MKNFVVNLDHRPEKYERFLKTNEGCGIAFERFPAVDGSQLTDQEVMEMRIVAPGSRFTRGAVGGTASMSRIWKLVAQQNAPALVFEDDCILRHDINAHLATLLPSLGNWDMLALGYNTDSVLDVELAPGMKSMMVFRPQYPNDESESAFQKSTSQVSAFRLNCCFGPAGYVLSPAGAQKLLQLILPMDNRPVAVEALGRVLLTTGADGMGNSIYSSINAYVCFAPLVLPRNQKATSTVQTSDARTWG